jgi:hypothetical protein
MRPHSTVDWVGRRGGDGGGVDGGTLDGEDEGLVAAAGLATAVAGAVDVLAVSDGVAVPQATASAAALTIATRRRAGSDKVTSLGRRSASIVLRT